MECLGNVVGMAGFERYIYPLPETLRLARLAGAKSAKRLARRAQINIKVLGFCWVMDSGEAICICYRSV